MSTKKKKAATPKKLAPSVAWDALWGGYVRSLRANKLDQAERFKKMIDTFDKTWLGIETRGRAPGFGSGRK